MSDLDEVHTEEDKVRQLADEAIKAEQYTIVMVRRRNTPDIDGAREIIRNNVNIHLLLIQDMRWVYQDFTPWNEEQFIEFHDKKLGTRVRRILEEQFLANRNEG